MPWFVFATVIAAAVVHAGWNALVKSAADKLLTTISVAAFAAALGAVLLPFLAAPARASWPCVAASAVFQVGYYLLLARTYQVADMSQTYPLMRGTAPLIVALISVFRIADALSPLAWAGILAICLGVASLALGSRSGDRRGIRLALLNAVVIAGYTLIDGVGVRRSGAPAAYTLWVFLVTGVPLALWAAVSRRSTFLPYLRRHWALGLVGGVGTTTSYGLALWAMTLAPVAVVAALRETSIVFGTVIAGLVLREHIGPRRLICAGIIAGGAAILRLA